MSYLVEPPKEFAMLERIGHEVPAVVPHRLSLGAPLKPDDCTLAKPLGGPIRLGAKERDLIGPDWVPNV